MAEGQVEGSRRRRSSRGRSSRKTSGGWIAYWQSARFGQHLFIAMALVAIAYAGLILYDTRLSTFQYRGLDIGDTESQVRYLLGTPAEAGAPENIITREEPGRRMTAVLEGGRLAAVRCTALNEAPSTCPDLLGIDIGDSEDQIWLRLGAPSREDYPGLDKTMHYDGLGMTFTLREYEVLALEIHEGASVIGYFPRALWMLVP